MNGALIVIAGPTASGKTRLGVALAHRLGSEIVSADSRQVYRGLDLGTGKDLAEYTATDPPIPHHLIDVAEPEEIFTLFHYQRAVYDILSERPAEAPPLIMVGGTGLYIEAVLKGYRIANVPENPTLRAALMPKDPRQLVTQLQREDPDLYSRTDCSSHKRVVRALEIVAYGREHELHTSEPPATPLRPLIFCVRIERSKLHERIRQRLDQRLGAGMVQEVEGLLARGLSHERLAMLGMEYREIASYLAGAKSYDDMRDTLEREIRRLAKRQDTWFRGLERRGLKTHWIAGDDLETILRELQGWSR